MLSLRGISENDPASLHRLADEIDTACRSLGFFGIVDHEIPAEMIERALTVSARFFALPALVKDRSREPGSTACRDATPCRSAARRRRPRWAPPPRRAARRATASRPAHHTMRATTHGDRRNQAAGARRHG
ncbi:hypothetical protein FRACA_90059 [Frankia canadensis]|uniref:Non-haem dioxygenase N-terminal domain-containing protein n=1 Tax=Frankia canadensis TaxID=1836972 RepID=A0A2I2L298_9ACTN|nr:hypothetical protein FRACA_90059 [Frankia canadensis]SOU59346.1 hypothetical protein FRACA_90059 [Frankia canadensis]